MWEENGGNGGRAQMNFISATMDMFASMYKMGDRHACLVGWYGQHCIRFFKSMGIPLELHISAHLHVIRQ